ncbi:heavy metal-associated domain-containing protein [Spongiivirga sp. MCCC 1A20706]|uniref:heavy-metal-associated domain-containing protein n=1 Tax=Spongiivirga sp. MCCC 1A20706 TaxID=3160963 RepID=UPI0039777E9E
MRSTLYLLNMKCKGCASTIARKLSGYEFLKNVTIDIEKGAVSFDHNTKNQVLLAKRQLAKLGYPCTENGSTFSQKAKSYVSCAVGRLHEVHAKD